MLWLAEWNAYRDTREVVADDMGIVRWWGLNTQRYPTWASLARDYLAIMASSVSSERAFSAAGITISKQCNRLKDDIVEALECLKALIHREILFRYVPTQLELEKEMAIDVEEAQDATAEAVSQADHFSWDQLLYSDDESDIELVEVTKT
jgi:hypothetical protein